MVEFTSTGDQMLVVLGAVARLGPITAAEAAKACNINRTGAHRLLATLAKHHFIEKTREGYSLGARTYELAAMARPNPISIAGPIVRELSYACKETVSLHAPQGVNAIAVDQASYAGHLIVVQNQIGSSHPLNLAASGWAILAFMNSRDQRAILRKLGDPLKETTTRRIAAIRARGWEMTRDELRTGVAGLAAPVFGADGNCVGCVVIIVPTIRVERLETFTEKLLQATAEISRQLRQAG